MQISQQLHNGDLVEIRQQRWRVLDVRTFAACQLVTVCGTGRENRDDRRRFLAPFDALLPIERRRTPRSVGIQRWRRACRALLADETPPGGLLVAGQARIDLLPHQLEPALAIVRGHGSRVLLADEVGLGKTIQAGLIAAELRARGLADRVLIVTPAGLRDQWRGELQNRFGIDAVVADMSELRRRAAMLPIGVNPWTTLPVAIASVDFIKRPEILRTAGSHRWDVVIVDEAHNVTAGTDRRAAIAQIAACASYVVLATATPHHGDSRAFAALCTIGARSDSLLVFRRSRKQIRIGTPRHIHTLRVRPTIAESRMFALLKAFAAAARAEHDSAEAWLALSVLHKRAFSSARSLGLTVERRLHALAGRLRDTSAQLLLPLSDDGGELDGADQPPDCLDALALADGDRERRLLTDVLDAAQSASRAESKIGVIRRLLRRTAEPILIFTEFRDTLQHVAAVVPESVSVLHGGLSRDERARALANFVNGHTRVLLATDAAGEGLNLHHRCRTVVNLELPWNPTRLEQRLGRVDRIGQFRRVEAFHLVGRDTGEERVLERLRARIAMAATEIDAVSPIEDDRRTAASVIDAGPDPRSDTPAPHAATNGVDADRIVIDLSETAMAEAGRLAHARTCSGEADVAALAALYATGPWIARTRLRSTRLHLRGQALAIVCLDDSQEPLNARRFVGLRMGNPGGPRRVDAISLLVDSEADHILEIARRAPHPTEEDAAAWQARFAATYLARQAQIAERQTDRSAVQPGLFDRRAERRQALEHAARTASLDDRGRTSEWHRTTAKSTRARLLLVLVA